MSPEVTAAWIAAGVSFATLVGPLAAQYLSRRATEGDLKEQRNQLDRTLEEQSKQLDRTLAEQRTRTLNERFATAAGQLGSDKPRARSPPMPAPSLSIVRRRASVPGSDT